MTDPEGRAAGRPRSPPPQATVRFAQVSALRAVTAWTQLFGAISVELFGHLKGAFSDDSPFFADSVNLMAYVVGFRPRQ